MYNNFRYKLLKFYKGGKIPKFQTPWGPMEELYQLFGVTNSENLPVQRLDALLGFNTPDKVTATFDKSKLFNKDILYDPSQNVDQTHIFEEAGLDFTDGSLDFLNPFNKGSLSEQAANGTLPEVGPIQLVEDDREALASLDAESEDFLKEAEFNIKKELAARKQARKEKNLENLGNVGAQYSGLIQGGAQMLDDALTGDKNFGAQSQAIDSAVHGASSALMKSGNPYAMAAGVALEGVNILSKAGGQTVQGFDVDIQGSGYGNLGHMESSSSRSLFGLGNRNLQRKLERRNELARMAIAASNISLDQSFELEARMNSILNTITNNLIALSGGIGLNSLGA